MIDLSTRLFRILLLCAVGLVGAPLGDAAADPTPPTAEDAKAEARRAFQRGTAEYQLEHFDAAIGHFERGYKLTQQPVFLYNIAQSYRLSDRPDKALTYYKRYLLEDPKARNRAEVEERMGILEKEAQEAEARKAEEARKAALPEPPPAPLLVVDAGPPPRPKRKLWPIVAGTAAGVVLLGTAIGLGIYFGTSGGGGPVWSPVTP